MREVVIQTKQGKADWLRLVAEKVEFAAAILMAIVTLLTFISAFMRYALDSPIPDAFDLGRLTLGVAIFWGVASVNYRGSHISVELLYGVMPARVKKGMDIVASTVVMLAFAMLTLAMSENAADVWRTSEHTYDLRLPIWGFYWMMVIGCGLAALLAGLRVIVAFIVDDIEEYLEDSNPEDDSDGA